MGRHLVWSNTNLAPLFTRPTERSLRVRDILWSCRTWVELFSWLYHTKAIQCANLYSYIGAKRITTSHTCQGKSRQIMSMGTGTCFHRECFQNEPKRSRYIWLSVGKYSTCINFLQLLSQDINSPSRLNDWWRSCICFSLMSEKMLSTCKHHHCAWPEPTLFAVWSLRTRRRKNNKAASLSFTWHVALNFKDSYFFDSQTLLGISFFNTKCHTSVKRSSPLNTKSNTKKYLIHLYGKELSSNT